MVSRGIEAQVLEGVEKVLPSTASVIAPKPDHREKSWGSSWRKATISSASVSPMFSMWCSEPDGMWNIWPASMVNAETTLPVSSTETSTVPEMQ